MTTSHYTARRYYRGYSLKQLPSGEWEIHWGELLHTSPTLKDAEKVVDEYHNAR